MASMFNFVHPKPFLQRAVAMQIAERKAALLPDLNVLVVETKQPEPPSLSVPGVTAST
ncbi:MAG: hypothetical protein V4633_03000 [Pseudomonadota bacterium]